MEAVQVIEKILSDARADADAVRRQADMAVKEQEEKLQIELRNYNSRTAELAQKAAQEKRLQMLARARMETAKEILAQKKKLLDEVFSLAETRIKQMSDNEYLALMEKLLLAAVKSGDEEVIVDKNERRIDENFIKQINQKLGPDRKGNLRLSKDKEPIGAGFILKRGKIKTNASIDVLLNQARDNLETELAKQLFE
jgi:V/A-type H+-transporting ATPase subunit E